MRLEAILESTIVLHALWKLSGFAAVAQIEAVTGTTIPWADIVQQYGGLALAVWLVIHHTMVTIPRMQADSKAEREALVKAHREELDAKRADYMAQIADQAAKHREELELIRSDFMKQMDAIQRTFAAAVERQMCRYSGGIH